MQLRKNPEKIPKRCKLISCVFNCDDLFFNHFLILQLKYIFPQIIAGGDYFFFCTKRL